MGWLDMQFEIAIGPAHATMELMADVRDASVKLAREVRELHEAPNQVLGVALTELKGQNINIATLTAMIGGMVLAATSHALRLPANKQAEVRDELRKAVGRMLAS
jgi:hypothetical protein